MGIKGLIKMLNENLSSHKTDDLISIAESRNGIEILVDSNAFMRTLTKLIAGKIVKDNDNHFLLYQIAEYDILVDATCEFHQHFRSAGIELVWIIDGPKGLDEEERKQKKEKWIERDKNDINFLNNLLEACKSKRDPRGIQRDINLGPFLGFESLIIGLKKADAEVIQLLQGGSDEFIAYQFPRRKSFAVITNDTDFLIFPNIKVIFPEMMNFRYGNDNLNLPFMDNENCGKIFKKPSSFYCPIFSQEDIFKIFKFTDPEQLISLSVIKGNDFTDHFSQEMQFKLKINRNRSRFAHVTEIAKFIIKNQITKEKLTQLLKNVYPQVIESVKFSYNFYTLKNFEDNLNDSLIVYKPKSDVSSLNNFLLKNFSMSKISKDLYSIHRGIFHELLFFEKPSLSCLSNSAVLSEIRSKIYPYVLDEKLMEVIEWQSRNSLNDKKVPVSHSVLKTHEVIGKPDGDKRSEHEKSIVYGIDIFEEIWSHLEENPPGFMKKFGTYKGFLCYILRYFFKNTIDKNLNLSQDEFRALFISVFYHYDKAQETNIELKLPRSRFLEMKICPTENCLIIFSWFMNIYFTGKYICGGALNLIEDFPSLDQVMSASVFFAFYEHKMNDRNQRITHLDESTIKSIDNCELDIMTNYNLEFESITKEI